MSTQHTPGPWIANDKDEVRSSENALLATVWDTHQKQENDGSTTYISGNAKANARLIAAAPELLEMVNQLSKSLTRTNDNDQRLYLEAKTLIAKLNDE